MEKIVDNEKEKFEYYVNILKSIYNEELDFVALSTEEKKEIINVKKEIFKKENKLKNAVLNIIKVKKSKRNTDKLVNLLNKAGLELETQEFKYLSKAEKKLIRIDYYGAISKPAEDLLSDFYKNTVNDPKNANKYPVDDYDLDSSSSWLLFKQFKNFRHIESRVKKQLRSSGIKPEDLNKMAVEDYMDIMHREFGKDESYYNSQLFLGAKYSFVKDFIKKFEKPFTKILNDSGVDKRYVAELVKSMKSNGVCDNITAYDEDGNELNGIKLSVHHKMAVNDASRKTKMGEINLFENLCLCIDDPYHSRILHCFDEIYTDEKGRQMRNSLSIKNKNIVFIGGLDATRQLEYDYANDPRSKRASDNIYNYEGSFISNDTEENAKKVQMPKKTTAAKASGKLSDKELQIEHALNEEMLIIEPLSNNDINSLEKFRISVSILKKTLGRR